METKKKRKARRQRVEAPVLRSISLGKQATVCLHRQEPHF